MADRIEFMLLDNFLWNYEYYDHSLAYMPKTKLKIQMYLLIANIVIDVDEMVAQWLVDWHVTP